MAAEPGALFGYAVAVASPDRHRLVSAALRDRGAAVIEIAVLSSESLGPAPAPAGRRTGVQRLARSVIRREVHAVLFGDVLALEVVLSTAERAGRLNGLLAAFTTDVAAIVSGPPIPRLIWEIPLSRYGGGVHLPRTWSGRSCTGARREWRSRCGRGLWAYPS